MIATSVKILDVKKILKGYPLLPLWYWPTVTEHVASVEYSFLILHGTFRDLFV